MIFRFWIVTVLVYMLEDALDWIFFAKSTPRKNQEDNSCNRRQESGELSIAHAEHHSRIDADEFDEKPFQTHPDEVKPRDFSHGTRPAQRLGPLLP